MIFTGTRLPGAEPTDLNGVRHSPVERALASGEHMPVLDGLRGVAILLVFATHAIAAPLAPAATRVDAAVHAIAYVGWTGVDLFFVLSGFLTPRASQDGGRTLSRAARCAFFRFTTAP